MLHLGILALVEAQFYLLPLKTTRGGGEDGVERWGCVVETRDCPTRSGHMEGGVLQ